MNQETSKRNEKIINKIFTPIDFMLIVGLPIMFFIIGTIGFLK